VARLFPAPFADVAVIALNQPVRQHSLLLLYRSLLPPDSRQHKQFHRNQLLPSRRSHSHLLRNSRFRQRHKRPPRSHQSLPAEAKHC